MLQVECHTEHDGSASAQVVESQVVGETDG